MAIDDADVQVVDEQADRGAGEPGAEADVVQPAVVAQSDRAPAVDLVVPDPVVGGDDRAGRNGFGSGRIGLGGGAPAQRAVRPDGVVVGLEPVQLVLQPDQSGGPGLGRAAISSGSGGTVPPCRRSADGTGGSGCSRIPRSPSWTSSATRPSPRCLAVKTAPLSVSTLAGRPHRPKAAVKVSTTCGPRVMRRALAAMLTREWSSRMLKISTSVPSASRQWVMSACQRSLGCSAQNRCQLDRGRFCG